MRKFILIAGFVLASAAAQAGDRSLSLAGSETTAATAPAKTADGPRTAEIPQAIEAPRVEAPRTATSNAETPNAETPKTEAPKYIERPAVVEPKAEAPKAETPKAAAVEQPTAEPAKPAARKTASTSKSEKPRRKRYWTEARIIRELHRHGIYW